MNKNLFTDLLSRADFKLLFNEMGWDYPVSHDEIRLALDDREWVIREVAQKCGFHVYVCETDDLPQHALRRKLDVQLRRYGNDYLLVFIRPGAPFCHQWIVPVKTVEKRELVTVEYATEDQASFLFEKIEAVSFGLTEQASIVDVTAKVHGAFTVNAAKITKDFYTGFRKQHEAFAAFIEGIPESDAEDRQWYASVMLNRLMFCYFIQKKGFLNLDFDYLQTKLRETRERQGHDKFYGSFYRKFLTVLFRDGLNAPRHDAAFEQTFGRIPYLNGGLFEAHRIEREHAGLDIKDQAFEDLFDFFDKWRWHLDTRMTASGRDINPDVLGYIFEQYINDRAKMGAYYTKEDITEYIAKNCIIPFLFDAVSRTDSAKHFKPGGFVWRLMKDSGDEFIYPAVKKGVDLPLPPEIERGVTVETKPGEPPLRERRAAWNAPADARYALPTEIWRETVARRQRCFDLRRKIAAGDVVSINDLVTCNLDIRAFAETVLEKTDDHLLIRHFYKVLQNITVLDPTCGSGAFLFAALNVLEPLYEICIARMQEFHAGNKNLFKEDLAEIENKYRSNIQHYIYKSIILRNLYGVDIMHEATEIAKLRLFLKMVAVVDVDKRAENLGLDPLPDIDFNIRCGNTLVGFANENEILAHYQNSDDALFAIQHRNEIREQCELVAQAFKRFKEIQLSQSAAHQTFVAAKADLNTRLDQLREKLDGLSATFAQTNPFHWIAEFYGIVQEHGGFDVIIGNPPYVTTRDILYTFQGKDELPDLYGYVVLRTLSLAQADSRYGMIIPVSIAFSGDFSTLRAAVTENKTAWFSSYDRIPGALFGGDVRQRCTIWIATSSKNDFVFTTPMFRWKTENRDCLFQRIAYELVRNINLDDRGIPKYELGFASLYTCFVCDLEKRREFFKHEIALSSTPTSLSFSSTAANFISISLDAPPCLDVETLRKDITSSNNCRISSEEARFVSLAILSGELYFWYWLARGDGFHVTSGNIIDFLASFGILQKEPFGHLHDVGQLLHAHRNEALVFKKNAGKFVGNYNYRGLFRFTRRADLVALAGLGIDRKTALSLFDYVQRVLAVNVFAGEKAIPNAVKAKYPPSTQPPANEASILSAADAFIRKHYGFTKEELDFVVNDDIKYRRGAGIEEKTTVRPPLTFEMFPNGAERFAAELSIRFAMVYPGLQVSDYAEAASMAFSAKEKFGTFLSHEPEKIQCVAAWRKMAKEKVFLQDASTPSVVQLTGDLRGSGWFEETPDTGTCTLSQRLAPDADVDAFVPLLHKAWHAWKKSEPSTTLVAQKQKKKTTACVLHDNGG